MTPDAAPDTPRTSPAWEAWTIRALAALAVLVPVILAATAWGGVVHGHPAYGVTLAVTAVLGALTLWRWRRARRAGGALLLFARVGGILATVAWIAVLAWMRPATAVEPALAAMESDGTVTVTESATAITMTPAGGGDSTGVLFQPGALVDARAYAAVLRPLAEAGHSVVITKQPFGIAFFNLGALDAARATHSEVSQWVVGGHSLGGVVASMSAEADASADAFTPVTGLLLFASYPAGDISGSLTAAVESISGSEDGLSTPAAIDASRADLPADAHFTVVEGAVHAYFGDYGTQRGDGTSTISHDDARAQISAAAVEFVDSLGD
ncbi:alpha/beta hydrolase [Demequina phytophila]|uniref:alpha/beta hydrolase n=1 Tax=Demequina phytophila TaxID=1638981 RepID=UPI00078378F1|nr:alpha/beta hydrolase [Demequina phytophila]